MKDNSPTSCILVLLMIVGVVVVSLPWECLYPSFYIKGGDVTIKITESVTI
jgi:hypothetical protein